jgi:hypothetical protein
MERGSIYPSWRYHPSGASKLIRTVAEDAALEPEWSDADVRLSAAPEPVSAPVVSDTIELAVEQDSPVEPPKRKPGRPRKDA